MKPRDHLIHLVPWGRRRTSQPSVSMWYHPPWVRQARWIQWSLVGLTLVALVAAWGWWEESRLLAGQAEHLENATTRTHAIIAQVSAQMTANGLTLSADELIRVRRDATFLNHLADKRAFSWVQLLSDLESTVPVPVLISSVKMNFQDSTVALLGLSKDLQSLHTFVNNLQRHPSFQKADLVSHHMQDKGDEPRGGGKLVTAPNDSAADIEFALTASYRVQPDSERGDHGAH